MLSAISIRMWYVVFFYTKRHSFRLLAPRVPRGVHVFSSIQRDRSLLRTWKGTEKSCKDGTPAVFYQFINNHCVCRNPTTLQIGNTHEHTVRRQTCCLSRACGVFVVVSGPSTASMVFRLVRSWLFCSSGFWWRLFVACFWLADVG